MCLCPVECCIGLLCSSELEQKPVGREVKTSFHLVKLSVLFFFCSLFNGKHRPVQIKLQHPHSVAASVILQAQGFELTKCFL